MQGFPWAPPAGSGRTVSIFNATEYLNHDLALEAAESLGVKKIWFNTGTFGRKYTLDPGNTVLVPAEKRLDILNGVLSEALDLKQIGFEVSVNLFSEDKSDTSEATDWSYLGGNEVVFVNFVSNLEKYGIGFSLYDIERIQ
jgi:hypothetical protein